MPASTNVDLQAHLQEIRTRLATIVGTPQVVIRATLPASAAYPQSASHIIVDLVPTTPTTSMDGSLYEDLAVQIGAWASDSLVTALSLADSASTKLLALGYQRTGGVQITTDDAYHGVLATYTLTAAFAAIT